ncbi:DUF1707 SHOCT-like domain-containing protein [Rhodococcus wratislaviensis]|uniref:DUF1707 SHOCT-like domain-containing protein n=1 Tax=Rhodococcus wratislaviensis TaxID=44752 RepID=UPI00364A88D4
MPRTTIAGIRARDSDRADACGMLDAALADGQLSAEEHTSRTSTAMRAKTFDELDRLIGDLQIPSRLSASPVVSPRRRRSSRRWVYAAVLVVAAAAVGGIAGAVANSDLGPSKSVPNLTTGAGLHFFLDEYRAEYGDTVADELGLYPAHAVFDRPSAGNALQSDSYLYDGEFDDWGSSSTRSDDEKSFDLGTVDQVAIAGLLAGAPETLRVPDGAVEIVSFRYEPGSDDGPPTISIHVKNAAGHTGHMVVGFDGEPFDIYPYEG